MPPGVYPRPPLADRFWTKVDKNGPIPAHRPDLGHCWLWTAARMRAGYGRFAISHGEIRFAHRVSYEMANGPIPDGNNVCHTCDNPPCVNPGHLGAEVQAVNLEDMDRKGRRRPARGVRSASAKLTEEIVVSLRQRYAAGGVTKVSLARELGVSATTVSLIVRGKKWKHVLGAIQSA